MCQAIVAQQAVQVFPSVHLEGSDKSIMHVSITLCEQISYWIMSGRFVESQHTLTMDASPSYRLCVPTIPLGLPSKPSVPG